MALDNRIESAIREAVNEEGQNPKVADRVIAWLDALTNGNETLGDTSAVTRHIQDLFEVTQPAEEE